MDKQSAPVQLEDDTKENMSLLIEHRLPWLVVGMLGGIGLTLVSAKFEHLLSKNIALAFFIPVIVYMADAVGTQTQTVFVRNLNKKRSHFSIYLVKESLLGLFLGLLFGSIIGLFAFFAFKSFSVALTVGLGMFVTMTFAPGLALIVPMLIKKEHQDPAVGSGPFTTVLQDFISLFMYFLIATLVLSMAS